MKGLLMKKNDAIKIASLCKSDLYPPTNPSILLRASLSLYKDFGECEELKSVVRWLNYSLNEEY